MKKCCILFVLLLGIISCQEDVPKGIWIKIKNKPLTKKNGFYYSLSSENSIMDFNKLERSSLSMPPDSIINFLIDYKAKTISKKNGKNKFNYELFGKDSIEIYYQRDNLTELFIPLNLNKKIELNKKQIIQNLVDKYFYAAKGELRLFFSSSYCEKDKYMSGSGVKNKKVLKTKYLDNKESVGNWYIREKDKNFFLFLNFNYIEQVVYQIEELGQNKIRLNGINTKGISKKITSLKTSL